MITYSHQIDFSTRATVRSLPAPAALAVIRDLPLDTSYLSEAASGVDFSVKDPFVQDLRELGLRTNIRNLCSGAHSRVPVHWENNGVELTRRPAIGRVPPNVASQFGHSPGESSMRILMFGDHPRRAVAKGGA